ncbi:MAG: ribonuclease HII [Halobacteriovorax sp.]|nr:ribonuclease HII [Halobacteriovorax sp.]|tara:strand:- start:488 stop:1171 length:684 start_codon:yes stop_codon:yes gene_type:complete
MEDLNYLSKDFLAGVDEVGRGPLAGPVVAACALITGGTSSDRESLLLEILKLGVTDSKKLSAIKRNKIINKLGHQVESLKCDSLLEVGTINNCHIHVSIREISPALIDSMNILAASLEAMANAFEQYEIKGNGWILVDGNHKLRKSWSGAEQVPLIKGDSRSVMIGLASIFAKEYRDHLMKKLGAIYPGYGLESHAGYPTPTHKEAIATLGVTPIHRKSFRGVKEHV